MKTRNDIQPAVNIESLILTVRGERVLLDMDLARIYGVPVKRLNEQVKRNADRFPADFTFQLTREEWLSVRSQPIDAVDVTGNRSQIATLPAEPCNLRMQNGAASAKSLRSQIATLNLGRGEHRKYLPWAFTEPGAIMAANVLNSTRAVQMSVFVVRAFVKMRELLGSTKELARQLRDLEAKLTARLDGHEAAIVDVLQRIMRLLDPPPEPPQPRRQIGFHARPDDEPAAASKGRRL